MQWVQKLFKPLQVVSKTPRMWQRQPRDRRARGSSPKSACSGALLVLLLNLLVLVLSGPAYASGAGSALPIEATSAVSGGAAQSGNSAAQQTVAPVRKAVEQTTAPVTGAGSKDVRTPTSSAVTQSASTVATRVLDTTTQTVKTAAPALQTAAKTVKATATPVIETARQSVAKTAAPVLKTAAPVLKTAAPVLKTVAPVLNRTEQTLVKAAAPVLQTATHTIGGAAAPVGEVTTSTIAGVVNGADGTTGLVGKVASQGIGQVIASADSTGTQAVSPVTTVAVHLTVPLTTPTAGKALSNPPVTPTQGPSGARYSVVTSTTPPPTTTAPSTSMLPSGLLPAPGAPQGISTSAKELLVESAATLLAQLAQLAQSGTAIESLSTFTPSPTGGNRHRAGTPAASSVPPAPAPRPVPGGSSPAMASTSGIAFSTFLTLAGLLLMGGLAAMRLLRLASEPWRRAPFVLIPERPG
jgi:hypothetical protein